MMKLKKKKKKTKGRRIKKGKKTWEEEIRRERSVLVFKTERCSKADAWKLRCVLRSDGFVFSELLSVTFLFVLLGVCNFCQWTSDQASEKEMKYSTDDETELHVWSKGRAVMLLGLWWIVQLR